MPQRGAAVERIKLASDGLRGGLREAAVSATPNFEESDVQLLKFHGVYQQDDRDQRVKRGEPRAKAWQMMIRLTIPGGVLETELSEPASADPSATATHLAPLGALR